MIVVDTSALMAVLLKEPMADLCRDRMAREDDLLISAGTAAEALVVAECRDLTSEMTRFIDELGFVIEPVTAAAARRIGQAYRQWGKGLHPAGLNFGDCFAYALAKEQACPLLFVGGDFARTDAVSAL
jgi:ribonuclease VapC